VDEIAYLFTRRSSRSSRRWRPALPS